MTTKTRARTAKNAKKDSVVSQLSNGLKLIGWVVSWDSPHGGTTFANVVKALEDAGLDKEIAKERLPEAAFTRAARTLEEEGAIDLLPNPLAPDHLEFQLSTRLLESKRWKYKERDVISLHKTTGHISCNDPKLRELVQAELDKHIALRTGNDITGIVKKLFALHTELIRWTDGVYLVLSPEALYADQIESFLVKIGGRLNRLPIPAGTQQGDRSVTAAVADHLSGLIAEHEEATAAFAVDVRPSSLEATAKKITETRVKLEAYASYLADRREELVASLDSAAQHLTQRIDEITKERTEKRLNGEPLCEGKDKFGCREGSKAAIINAVLSDEPQSLKQLSEALGAEITKQLPNHLRFLVVKGYATKSTEGYALAPAK